jgi:bifunctional non-homologous end joining protein LigD
MERRTVLERIIKPTAGVQLGTYVDSRGIGLFNLAKEKGMEGIVAKRKDGIHHSGKKTPDWLKIKSRPQQEFVVGGFTEGRGSRQRSFGALLLGAYRDGNLHYFGHSGSGFSEKGLKEALEKMKPFFTSRSPFDNSPKVKEKIQWLKPNLVCEVAYAEITADEQLRQTTFLGRRDDKKPEEVVLEQI